MAECEMFEAFFRSLRLTGVFSHKAQSTPNIRKRNSHIFKLSGSFTSFDIFHFLFHESKHFDFS